MKSNKFMFVYPPQTFLVFRIVSFLINIRWSGALVGDGGWGWLES